MKFPCTCCGVCCRNIGNIEVLKNFDCGDGICKYLSSNHLCSIYYQRPLICRIDEFYNHFFLKHMSKNEFYKQNADACNSMQENLNSDIKYRVQLFKN